MKNCRLSLLSDNEVSKIAFGELYDTVCRAAFKELFEVTKKYCQETNRLDVLQGKDWYQFWRVLRNCFSHTFKFAFNDYERTKLPVSWNGITIEEAMEGHPLTHGDISREKLIAFLAEVFEFIENDLT